MMCADTIAYSNAQFKPELQCDIGFVGGYWPYKGLVIDRYLMPLLYPVGKYNVKIFGNQPWPCNQYCGKLSGETDVCFGFCISDYVDGYNIFGDGIVMASNPQEFKEEIDFYLEDPDERRKISTRGRKIVQNSHTGFHRAAEIMTLFGYMKESKKLLELAKNEQ